MVCVKCNSESLVLDVLGPWWGSWPICWSSWYLTQVVHWATKSYASPFSGYAQEALEIFLLTNSVTAGKVAHYSALVTVHIASNSHYTVHCESFLFCVVCEQENIDMIQHCKLHAYIYEIVCGSWVCNLRSPVHKLGYSKCRLGYSV